MGRTINLLVLIFFISACSLINKKDVQKELYELDDFNSELILKYQQYALASKNKGIKKDYKYFNKKSKKINKLTDEEILTTKYNKKLLFSEKERFEIYNYKQRLLDLVYDYNIKSTHSIKTSNLFFFLDCWNYYAFISNNYTQAMYCRNNFVDTFLATEREFKQEDNTYYKNDTSNLELTEEEKKFFDKFNNKNYVNIYFDFDSYKLNNEALLEIKNFLKYLSNINEDYKIILIGHTDRYGNVFYNNKLSMKRSKTVYNTLVKNGVPSEFIKINGIGSKDPFVITDNNGKNKLNRRVEIRIEKNYDIKQDYIPQPL